MLLTSTALPVLAESKADTQTSPTPQAQVTRRHGGQGSFDSSGKNPSHGARGFSNPYEALQRFQDGIRGILTEEQKAQREAASADLQAAYREYLGQLADASIVSAEELAAYDRIQQQKALANAINTDQWTVEKDRAFREALKQSGEEKAAALTVFVGEGLLTQEQADALVATSTSIRDIDFDTWTVGDAKELMSAAQKTGSERVATVNGFIAKGLLTQSQADSILSANLITAGRRISSTLTDEQKTALEAAQKALSDRCQQIRNSLKTDKPQEQGQV